MPNRYVRESAIESERVNKLGWHAEVFWRRLINKVDDFGRFTSHPELLRAAVFPMQLNKVSAADVSKLLLECENAGLVSTWKGQLDGKPYLVMNKWERGRAKESKYPEPPADVYTCLHVRTDVPDSDPDSDSDSDPEKSGRTKARPAAVSDEEWLKSLRNDPAYAHIRVSEEHGKMVRWCEVNKRQPTRRRFINWLNRIEPPFSGPKRTKPLCSPTPVLQKDTRPPEVQEQERAAARERARQQTEELRRKLQGGNQEAA